MKQTDLGLNLTTKRTRKREFLAQMERVMPWTALVELVSPYAPEGKKGRPPFPVQTMLRIHCMPESGLVHSVRGTAANVNDVVKANRLLHGQETDVFADAGHQGPAKRPDAADDVNWHVAMRPGKRRALDKTKTIDKLIAQVERIKASVRAKGEHPFRVIKQQFGRVKVRYRGLKKNTAQLRTLFALSNLWMARAKLLVLDGRIPPKAANAA